MTNLQLLEVMKLQNMIDAPKVTLLVPVFNEPEHILEQSLLSVMAQTFTDFECIVVDESTRSEVAEVCENICKRDTRFRYVHPTKRLGLSGSLNLAISMARGQFLARFDSDDVCMPERLRLQTDFLKANPGISVVGGAIEIISTKGRVIARQVYPQTPAEIAKRLQITNAIAHPTVMYRREVVDLFGSYNINYRYCEDLDLWLRWVNAGVLFGNLPKVLVQYRQDNSRRERLHWGYNFRTRVSNFDKKYVIRRIIGIVCVLAWMVTPASLQDKIYKIINRRREIKE